MWRCLSRLNVYRGGKFLVAKAKLDALSGGPNWLVDASGPLHVRSIESIVEIETRDDIWPNIASVIGFLKKQLSKQNAKQNTFGSIYDSDSNIFNQQLRLLRWPTYIVPPMFSNRNSRPHRGWGLGIYPTSSIEKTCFFVLFSFSWHWSSWANPGDPRIPWSWWCLCSRPGKTAGIPKTWGGLKTGADQKLGTSAVSSLLSCSIHLNLVALYSLFSHC